MTQTISLHTQETSPSLRKITTFIALALGLGWAFQAAAILSGVNFNALEESSSAVWVLLIGIAWAPAFAGIITQVLFRRQSPGIRWGRPSLRWFGLAFVLPLFFAGVSYGMAWLVSPAAFVPGLLLPAASEMLGTGWASDSVIILVYQLATVLMYLIPIGIFALGEEMGWTGLLIPHLRKVTSFRNTALIFGTLWGLYHLPLMLFAEYTGGVPLSYGILMNMVVLLGFGVTQTWLCLKSQSLWPALLSHTLWNVLIFYIFDPMTQPTSLSSYLVGEKGLFTAILVLLVAAWIGWRDSNK